MSYFEIDPDKTEFDLKEVKSMYQLTKINGVFGDDDDISVIYSGSISSVKKRMFLLLKELFCSDITEISKYIKDGYNIRKRINTNTIEAYIDGGYKEFIIKLKKVSDTNNYEYSIDFKDDTILTKYCTYVISKDDQLTELYTQNKTLKMMKREIYYAPGGEGYKEALASFTSLLDNSY